MPHRTILTMVLDAFSRLLKQRIQTLDATVKEQARRLEKLLREQHVSHGARWGGSSRDALGGGLDGTVAHVEVLTKGLERQRRSGLRSRVETHTMRGSRSIGTALLILWAAGAAGGQSGSSGTEGLGSLAGLAPGRALAGQQVVVYGSGLRGARCVLAGPVAAPTALPVAPPGPEVFARTAARPPTPEQPTRDLAAWITTSVSDYLGQGVLRLAAPNLQRDRRF